MFVVNDLPPPVDPALLDLLRRAEPATIGHFRHTGFMDPSIRALLPDRRIAGTAVTLRCYGADTSIVHYALGRLRAGDVLVMGRAGDMRHAACGGGVRSARYAGSFARLPGSRDKARRVEVARHRQRHAWRYGLERTRPHSPENPGWRKTNVWSRALRCVPLRPGRIGPGRGSQPDTGPARSLPPGAARGTLCLSSVPRERVKRERRAPWLDLRGPGASRRLPPQLSAASRWPVRLHP